MVAAIRIWSLSHGMAVLLWSGLKTRKAALPNITSVLLGIILLAAKIAARLARVMTAAFRVTVAPRATAATKVTATAQATAARIWTLIMATAMASSGEITAAPCFSSASAKT